MKIEGEKIYFFQQLFDEAKAKRTAEYEKFTQHMEQYKGSDLIDGSNTRAKVVRNITYELIESQISSDIPSPAVSTEMWSERTERNAKSVENLLRSKRDKLLYEKINDMDERYNFIYGGSVWLIEWDNSLKTNTTTGDVVISLVSPEKFIGQPFVYNIEDMEYLFLTFTSTKEDIARKYDISFAKASKAVNEEDADDQTATVNICFYRNDNDEVCKYVWSDDVELLDINDYYGRKIKRCKLCGKTEDDCECEKPKYETLTEEYEDIITPIIRSFGEPIYPETPKIENGQVVYETEQRSVLSATGTPQMAEAIEGIPMPAYTEIQVPVMEKTKLPYYRPKKFPVVIRRNTSQEYSVFGQSDCEFIRPQQQTINKIETRILEKLIDGGVYPILPEDVRGQFLDSSVNKRILYSNQANFALYNKLDLTADISRDVAESDRVYDHAKRILGITDAFQGQKDTTAKSGVAKQIQVSQSSGRLNSKRVMKNLAYSEVDEVIFQLFLAFADEPRPATYVDGEGNQQNIEFNKYDFVEIDENGEYYYNDRYTFSVDRSSASEKDREFLWSENRQNLQSGAYGDPMNPETLLFFWQHMEKAHYPFARTLTERMREQIKQRNAMLEQQQQLMAQGLIPTQEGK